MQRTILIVGGTSGLGRKLCDLYCAEGNIVGIIGRRQDLLSEIQSQHGDKVRAFQIDISERNALLQIRSVIKSLAGIDLLILAASVIDFNPDLDFERERNLFLVNVIGYAGVLNEAYHYFSNKGNGHIVGVTSMAGARGNVKTPAYNASKAFQSSYLESIRFRLQSERKPVFVTELVPGYMDTAMAKGDRMFWVAGIDKAARVAKQAIQKRKQRAFITKRWYFLYHVYRLLPSFIYGPLVRSSLKIQK